MPIAQNAHAYVNAGFLIEYSNTNGIVNKKLIACNRICYGGINPSVKLQDNSFHILNRIQDFGTFSLDSLFTPVPLKLQFWERICTPIRPFKLPWEH